jgi:hypothetical protein
MKDVIIGILAASCILFGALYLTKRNAYSKMIDKVSKMDAEYTAKIDSLDSISNEYKLIIDASLILADAQKNDLSNETITALPIFDFSRVYSSSDADKRRTISNLVSRLDSSYRELYAIYSSDSFRYHNSSIGIVPDSLRIRKRPNKGPSQD